MSPRWDRRWEIIHEQGKVLPSAIRTILSSIIWGSTARGGSSDDAEKSFCLRERLRADAHSLAHVLWDETTFRPFADAEDLLCRPTGPEGAVSVIPAVRCVALTGLPFVRCDG
jgi:hypothetical protein